MDEDIGFSPAGLLYADFVRPDDVHVIIGDGANDAVEKSIIGDLFAGLFNLVTKYEELVEMLLELGRIGTLDGGELPPERVHSASPALATLKLNVASKHSDSMFIVPTTRFT